MSSNVHPNPGLGSTNKSAASLFLLSDSRFVLTTLSSPLFFLPQSLWQISQELYFLYSCSIRLYWVPGHTFLLTNNAADELARWGAILAPSAIPCSFSPLISRIQCSHFTDWKRTIASKFFDTYRFFRYSPRNLWSLVTFIVFSLVYAATDTAFY